MAGLADISDLAQSMTDALPGHPSPLLVAGIVVLGAVALFLRGTTGAVGGVRATRSGGADPSLRSGSIGAGPVGGRRDSSRGDDRGLDDRDAGDRAALIDRLKSELADEIADSERLYSEMQADIRSAEQEEEGSADFRFFESRIFANERQLQQTNLRIQDLHGRIQAASAN